MIENKFVWNDIGCQNHWYKHKLLQNLKVFSLDLYFKTNRAHGIMLLARGSVDGILLTHFPVHGIMSQAPRSAH